MIHSIQAHKGPLLSIMPGGAQFSIKYKSCFLPVQDNNMAFPSPPLWGRLGQREPGNRHDNWVRGVSKSEWTRHSVPKGQTCVFWPLPTSVLVPSGTEPNSEHNPAPLPGLPVNSVYGAQRKPREPAGSQLFLLESWVFRLITSFVHVILFSPIIMSHSDSALGCKCVITSRGLCSETFAKMGKPHFERKAGVFVQEHCSLEQSVVKGGFRRYMALGYTYLIAYFKVAFCSAGYSVRLGTKWRFYQGMKATCVS